MSRAAILVLGMHRSGTSALTWLVGQLGATLPGDPMVPTEENVRGFWESDSLARADEQLLRVCRSSWFDPRPLDWSRLPASGLASRKARIREAIEQSWGDAPLLVIKDPRQCRCVPVIRDVLDEMGVEPRAILMLRDPAEVARSLERRDRFTPAFAHLLWLRHVIDAERHTRGIPRIVLDYAALLRDWRREVTRILPLTGRDGWLPDDTLAATIDAFLDPDLRHYSALAPVPLPEPLGGLVARLKRGLERLRDADDDAARAALDQVYAEVEAMPALDGDIVHDELRHRVLAGAQAAEPPAAVPVAASPAPHMPAPEDAAVLVRDSGLFDAEWYLTQYLDARESGMDPVEHYLSIGAAQGHDPNPLFRTAFYARQMQRRTERDPAQS